MISTETARFSNPVWLRENAFHALSEIAWLLSAKENVGRDALIRALEHQQAFANYHPILMSLVQKAGLYPYLSDSEGLSTADLLNFEFHKVEGLDEIVLHSVQGKIYRSLVDGANVILSAPTSVLSLTLLYTLPPSPVLYQHLLSR
jgi:hypothetical protein